MTLLRDWPMSLTLRATDCIGFIVASHCEGWGWQLSKRPKGDRLRRSPFCCLCCDFWSPWLMQDVLVRSAARRLIAKVSTPKGDTESGRHIGMAAIPPRLSVSRA
jgi:hypothetical protein